MLTSEEGQIPTGDDDDEDLGRRCRFCADVRPSESDSGWTEVWDDVELQKLVYYYTPIKILSSSPFPSLLCPRCLRLLSLVREFFVLLNEGQAMLAEITNKSPSSPSKPKVMMPDWEAERDTLFREKYPCPTTSATDSKIRRVVKRTAEESPAATDSEEVKVRDKKRRRMQPKRYDNVANDVNAGIYDPNVKVDDLPHKQFYMLEHPKIAILFKV